MARPWINLPVTSSSWKFQNLKLNPHPSDGGYINKIQKKSSCNVETLTMERLIILEFWSADCRPVGY